MNFATEVWNNAKQNSIVKCCRSSNATCNTGNIFKFLKKQQRNKNMECKESSHWGAQFSHFCIRNPKLISVFLYHLKLFNYDYISKYPLLWDAASTDLLGAVHSPHHTVSMVRAQTSCHVGVGGSNCNQLASFTTANWWNIAYLGGNLWQKNGMLEKNCNFGISMPIPVLISIKI